MPRLLRRARPAAERQWRTAEWQRWFAGDGTEHAYRRELVRETGLTPELAWELVRDLAPLLVDRVPASLGVPALLATNVLALGAAKPAEAAWALLAATLEELDPPHARTVLEALALAWQEGRNSIASEERKRTIRSELTRTLRRLAASAVPSIDALLTVLAALEERSDNGERNAILDGT
ncbi:MAG: hypothetical protein RMH81_08890 [Thermomicrobium sp.]|nr:hypothetical protein [Thermomicrobium sp.]